MQCISTRSSYLLRCFRMQMHAMNQYGNRGFGGPPQPQRQGGRRGNNRGGFRNSRFEQNQNNQQQQQRNFNQGQGGQRPIEVSFLNYLLVITQSYIPYELKYYQPNNRNFRAENRKTAKFLATPSCYCVVEVHKYSYCWLTSIPA